MSEKRRIHKEKKLKFRNKHPIIFYSLFSLFACGILVTTLMFAYVRKVLESVPSVNEYMLRSDSTSNMYDAKGNLIWSSTEIRRDYIAYDKIPQAYIDLLLSTEDRTFFTDPGFSWKGLANAGVSTFKEKLGKGSSRGGSTIEQQLIKYVAFSTQLKDRTIDRKIKELWLAQQLYENFNKNQILEWYINKINMGESSHGADTICMTYFGVHLYNLKDKTPQNLSKLAIIAGLGQAPSLYNLYDKPDLVEKRRNDVLYSAYLNHKITKLQMKQAIAIPVNDGLKERYWRNTEILEQVKRHSAFVNAALKQIGDLGYDLKQTPLQIYTSLDPDQNDWLAQQMNQSIYYQDDRQQSAATVVDNQTGHVIAQFGGRNNQEAYGLNRATQRTRSSGSSTKPFISYGPLIEYQGVKGDLLVDSGPYTYPGTNLVAQNYGGENYGKVNLNFALRMSLNTPAIRILDEMIGSQKAKKFLANVGLDVKDHYGGGDALGINISTADLASAYASIANNGVYKPTQYITSLIFADGSKKQIQLSSYQAMKQSTAYILNKMLQGVPKPGGTGQAADIEAFKGYFLKTGTVGYEDNAAFYRDPLAASDLWVGGATKSVSMAVWTGYDAPNEPNGWLSSQTKTNQYIFKDAMMHFNEGKDTSDWDKPETVNQFGEDLKAFYQPNDTKIQSKLVISKLNNRILPKTPLEENHEISSKYQVPENYQSKKWIEELNDEDKQIYQKYNEWKQSGEETYQFDYPADIYHN